MRLSAILPAAAAGLADRSLVHRRISAKRWVRSTSVRRHGKETFRAFV
jgi:hypothetical protein